MSLLTFTKRMVGWSVMILFHILTRATGYFVRIAENEVSVSHPDAVKQLLHANIAKVCISLDNRKSKSTQY